ncbi:hypothetical protein LJC12_04625, partial [Odoribacter sp. OttesenSCG-928-J03]|nr:hypothetical protein [Odoribacter sp. OttesenSCG-928-J03]
MRFKDSKGSLYAFDEWVPAYSSSFMIREKYEQLAQEYRVPFKLIPPGKCDKVDAVFESLIDTLDLTKMIFITRTGSEYKTENFDKSSKRYTLSVVGGEKNDGQELYALYPKDDGSYYNLGKLSIRSYPSYRFKVMIVPVGSSLSKAEERSFRDEITSVYSRIGVDCEIEFDTPFAYEGDLSLFDKGSGLLSAYNAKMKALNSAYQSERNVDKSTSYLFIFDKKSGHEGRQNDRDVRAFMPRNKQFGYLYRKYISSDKLGIDAAHELGHGRFSLEHPFDRSWGLPQGATDNLMDYTDGRHLAKWQWDIIHDPGVVVRVFERNEDGMKIDISALSEGNKDKLKKSISILLEKNTGGIFNLVYEMIKKSPELFKIEAYYYKGNMYLTKDSRAHFRMAEEKQEVSIWDILIAWILGEDVTPKLIKPGEEQNPHYIKFNEMNEKGIESSINSLPTVFEELFHAAQYLYYGPNKTQLYKETEVKIVKAYIIYINGGYHNNKFEKW